MGTSFGLGRRRSMPYIDLPLKLKNTRQAETNGALQRVKEIPLDFREKPHKKKTTNRKQGKGKSNQETQTSNTPSRRHENVDCPLPSCKEMGSTGAFNE